MPFLAKGEDLVWEPNKRQEDFLQLPDDIFEALYGGQAGGGKSEVLLYLPIVRGWYQHSRFHGGLVRTSFRKLDETLIPRSKEIYPHFGAEYNDTKKLWTFPSGAQIRFIYLERREHAMDHDSSEFNYLGYDELTEQGDEWIYNFMTSRVRSSFNLPALVRSGTNPGGAGHAWVKRRFIDPCKSGYSIIYDHKTETRRIFIPAAITDNPVLMLNDPGYAKRLNILGEAERKAKLLGDWDIYAGQVFTEFRVDRIIGEPNEALHVVEPFKIPDYLPNIAAIDWGKAAMTYFCVGAVRPNGQCIIHTQYGQVGLNPREWARDFLEVTKNLNLKHVVIDPSSKRIGTSDDKSVFDQFIDACRIEFGDDFPFTVEIADNNRIGGKQLLHEYLRWRQIDPIKIDAKDFDVEFANRILRIKGSQAHEEYCAQFREREKETNLPKLLIFKGSERSIGMDVSDHKLNSLVDALNACTYNTTGHGNPEDVMEFEGDDPYDTIRYLVKRVDRYIQESKNLTKKNTALEDIYNELAITQDQTRFYRRMEMLEKRGSTKSVPLFKSHSKVINRLSARGNPVAKVYRKSWGSRVW